MPEITIKFDNEKLKEEFTGWLLDGGGEDSFNLLENVGYFSYSGNDIINVTTPT